MGFCVRLLAVETSIWASVLLYWMRIPEFGLLLQVLRVGTRVLKFCFRVLAWRTKKLGLSFRVLGVVKSGVSTAVKEADASRHNGPIKDPCITVNDTEGCKVVWTNQGPDHFGQALSWLDMNCWGFWPGFIFPLVRN